MCAVKVRNAKLRNYLNKGIFKTVRITLGDGKFPNVFLKGEFLFVLKGKRLRNLSPVLRETFNKRSPQRLSR